MTQDTSTLSLPVVQCDGKEWVRLVDITATILSHLEYNERSHVARTYREKNAARRISGVGRSGFYIEKSDVANFIAFAQNADIQTYARKSIAKFASINKRRSSVTKPFVTLNIEDRPVQISSVEALQELFDGMIGYANRCDEEIATLKEINRKAEGEIRLMGAEMSVLRQECGELKFAIKKLIQTAKTERGLERKAAVSAEPARREGLLRRVGGFLGMKGEAA